MKDVRTYPKQPFLSRLKLESGISLVVWPQAKTPQSLAIFLASAGFKYHSSSEFTSLVFTGVTQSFGLKVFGAFEY